MENSSFNQENPTHLFNRKTFILVVFLLVVFKTITSVITPKQNSYASDLTIDNILNAVNRERSLRNINALNTNSLLSIAAQSKSDDMQARHYFAHVDPDGNYVWKKIVEAGYTPYVQLGENLAIEFYDTESLVSAWMNSPTHRANILQEGFKDQGMGLNFGDSALNQYHSAITNTFGTLASTQKKNTTKKIIETKVEKTPTPAVQSSPPITKAPETPKPISESPVATPMPKNEIATPTTPLLARGEPKAAATDNATEHNFALPNQATTTETTETSTPSQNTPGFNFPDLESLKNPSSGNLTNSQINRYLILICGVALLLIMLLDFKIAVEKKFGSLDKKTNNLAVLLISLIVIAFIYWL